MGLVVGQRCLAPFQRLSVLPLHHQRHAEAILAIGGEQRIAGAGAGLDLTLAPLLRDPENLIAFIGDGERRHRVTERERIGAGFGCADGAHAEIERAPGLADRGVKLGRGTQHPRRLLGCRRQVGHGLVEQGERLRPVFEDGGDADGGDIHAHPQRRTQVIVGQQLHQPALRTGIVPGQGQIAQPCVILLVRCRVRVGDAFRRALGKRRLHPECVRGKFGIGLIPGGRCHAAGIKRQARRRQDQRAQDREDSGHEESRSGRPVIRRRPERCGWWRTGRRSNR